jgi:hypothetical protein
MENTLPEWPEDVPGVSTDEIAAHHDVRPSTVRERVCREGSYWGLVPRRRANGRLEFHPRYREILRRVAKQQEPRPHPKPKHRQNTEASAGGAA